MRSFSQREAIKDRNFLFLSFVLFLIGFVFRIVNLTSWPIFADEAIYIRWAQVMRAEETLRFLPLSDGKQPLFMWVMIPFLKLFTDPLFAGRFLSLLCGLLTMFGILIFSLFLFKDKRIIIFSLFLYAFSPFAVFFERMALVDSMLSMFGLWAFLLSFLSLKYKRTDLAIFAGFSLGAALITKSPALFFVLFLPSVLLLQDWQKKEVEKQILTSFFLLFLTYIIAYSIYNILRLGPNFHLLSSRNYDYVFSLSHILEDPFDPFFGHLKDIFLWFFYFNSLFLIILFVIGVWQGFIYYKKQTLFLLILFLLPLFIQAEYAKVFTARYVLFVLPYFVLISSLSFFSSKLKVLSWLLLLGFVTFSIFQNVSFAFRKESAFLPENERSGYLEEWTAGYGIKEVANYLVILSKEKNGQEILVGTEGYFGTLPDGLEIYLNSYPNIKVVGMGLDFKEVPSGLIESSKNGVLTFFVVNSSRSKISDFSHLQRLAEYPKAKKKDGSFEKLLFYKVD